MIRINWTGSIFPSIQINIPIIRGIDAVMTWIERAQQRRALARLDDRLLRDIGISRADALREADRAAWKG
ncbi:DUF1127 domain-containing protein [Magnetospirillum sulfuroxidans]|uniref:DUF1127 domain-containing protein n=1 Tax=Magnetospirillum sulfuroxidans TaxID=611300 RepID=A0ABS5I9I5_9PROT|nr:DUF1127 domain-containing protein [Magnetospirillum sulfuroxidans]MBR9970984.1 DUF1127 domain-containing protein [Magnetospirillum sulfuroxidans]